MRTVRDLLSSKPKPFNVIQPTALVIDALNLMNSVNLSYLIVMDNDKFNGLFSERDYSRKVILKGRSSDSTAVMEVMATDLPIVTVSDTVEYCMNLMNSHRTRYLVAFDGQQFAGVITIHDLLRQVIFNKDEVFNSSVTSTLIDYDESDRIY
ncbi:MAG: CBS domain-containing protein [Chitinophagaceae bacterium]